jgi:hypothetical protein
LYLLQRIPGDGLERLFHVDGILGAGLKVWDAAFALAPRHGTLLGDLCKPPALAI